MWTRFWRRLAGCIAISGGLVSAAQHDYRVGTAEAGGVKAIVFEDRQGNRAAIADARFTISLTTADRIAAQLLRSYPLNRAGILLHSAAAGEPAPADAINAIAAALGSLEPARVSFDGSKISVTSEEDRCRAVFFPLRFEGCSGGEPVRQPVRAAFQVFEPRHGLQQRGETPPAYPIQAIALGKQVTILALGGDAPGARFQSRRVIVVPRSNDSAPLPGDPAIDAAIRQVLDRVGH